MGLDMFLENKNGEEMYYWRKANAIHQWFRDHCGYNDYNWDTPAEPVEVTRDDLITLIEKCKSIVSAKNELGDGDEFVDFCERELPTSEGFFFGSTDYDDWYLNKIINTIDELSEVIEKMEDGDIYYYLASW